MAPEVPSETTRSGGMCSLTRPSITAYGNPSWTLVGGVFGCEGHVSSKEVTRQVNSRDSTTMTGRELFQVGPELGIS